MLERSAQCKSSTKNTSGPSRVSASRKATNSRFLRSWENPVNVSGKPPARGISANQLGATAFMTSEAVSLDWLLSKSSNASRMGRYASVPPSRSEHRPTAIWHRASRDTRSRKASASIVLLNLAFRRGKSWNRIYVLLHRSSDSIRLTRFPVLHNWGPGGGQAPLGLRPSWGAPRVGGIRAHSRPSANR